MNGFIAHTSEWLLSVPGNAGSQSKNRLWDKLPNCSLEGLRGHMPVFLLRIGMFLKAKLNPVLLCISSSTSEAEHCTYVRVNSVFSWQWSVHVDWFLPLRLHELVMYAGWDGNHLLCTPQVFSPDFCFFCLLISRSVFMAPWSACPLCPALSCHACDILHCGVMFASVSRWLPALMFDPGVIKFMGSFLG